MLFSGVDEGKCVGMFRFRYRIVAIVTIGEKASQDVYVGCRFLWDAQRDRYAKFVCDNMQVFAIALCFGLYYE